MRVTQNDSAVQPPPGTFPGTEAQFTSAIAAPDTRLIPARFATRPSSLMAAAGTGTRMGGDIGYGIGKQAMWLGPVPFMMGSAAGTLAGGTIGAAAGLACGAVGYAAPRLGNLVIDAVNAADRAVRGKPQDAEPAGSGRSG